MAAEQHEGVPGPSPGDTLGRFLLMELLPSEPGGDAGPRSFLAFDRESLEPVILRLGSRPAEEPFLAAFLAGIDELPRVQAPSLPRIVSGGHLEGWIYQASTWIPGVDLGTLLGKGPPGVEVAIPILWNLAEALSSLHARGLVHGDLRPSNTRLTPGGEVLLVHLSPPPLGLSRADRCPEAELPRYAAPERNQGQAHTASGDIYSLGLVLYELFAGKQLFVDGTREQVLQHQLRADKVIESGATLSKSVPPPIQPVLRDMLRLDPARRIRTATELQQFLVAAVPDLTAAGSLRKVPTRTLASALTRSTAELLRRARGLLLERQGLPAAACLWRAAQLLERFPTSLAEELGELLREALWHGFLLSGTPQDRTRLQAHCFCLLRASEVLGDPRLRELVGRRLGVFASRSGPLAGLLPELVGVEAMQQRRQELLGVVPESPGDDLTLLELAASTPGFHGRLGTSVHALKANLLEQEDLAAAALLHASRDLTGRSDDEPVIRRVRDLADRALGGELPQAPKQPEREPPRLAEPSSEPSLDLPLPPRPSLVAPEPRPFVSPFLPDPSTRLAAEEESFRELSTSEILRHLQDAESHLEAGNFLDALSLYEQVRRGKGLQERFLPQVVEPVRRIVRGFLLPGSRAARANRNSLLEAVGVTTAVGLKDLSPIAERLLLDGLPEPEAELAWSERLLALVPESVAALRVAQEACRVREDRATRAGYLIRLGQALLSMGAVREAASIVQAALEEQPDSAAAIEGMARVNQRLETQPVVESELSSIELGMQSGEIGQDKALVALDEFLAWHPTFLPAIQVRANLAFEVGDKAAALRHSQTLALVALALERRAVARSHFQSMLRCEPGYLDAFLYLSYMNPLPEDIEGDEADLEVALLRQEGLFDVAIHRVRARLQGGFEDLLIHEQLVELCRLANLDASPHLAAQGFLALQAGESELARRCFLEAIEESPNRAALLAALRKTHGIEKVFSIQELVKLHQA